MLLFVSILQTIHSWYTTVTYVRNYVYIFVRNTHLFIVGVAATYVVSRDLTSCRLSTMSINNCLLVCRRPMSVTYRWMMTYARCDAHTHTHGMHTWYSTQRCFESWTSKECRRCKFHQIFMINAAILAAYTWLLVAPIYSPATGACAYWIIIPMNGVCAEPNELLH